MSRQPTRKAWTSERLLHERAIALGCAIEASSIASYSSALQSYLTFCQLHSFPIDPTPDSLSFFIVFMCHHIKPKSVSVYLSGICNQLEPFFPNVREARQHKIVVNTLRGCTKMRAVPTTRKLPLARSDLDRVRLHYGASDFHDDLLFVAQLFTGFHGLLRLGELVWPDKKSLQDYRKISMRPSVKMLPQSYSFLLPSHKADRLFEGNTIMIHATSVGDNPLVPFISYLASRDRLFPANPELWLRADGTIPLRRWFLQRFHFFFPKTMAGQSMRAGGATALAQAGVPPHIIQSIGRWASEAFHIYIRQHPVLLAAVLCSQPRSS